MSGRVGARIASAALFLIACPRIGLGQESARVYDIPSGADSLVRRNTLSLLFDRNLNTYNWIGRLIMDTLAGTTRVGVKSQYVSNIIVANPAASDNHRLRSDQVNLALLLSHPVVPGIDMQSQWSSLVSTDNKGVGLSNASSHAVLAGVSATPMTWLTTIPMAGYRWDDQAGIRDRGPSMNIGGMIHDVSVEGYEMGGALQFHRDMLNPRVLESHFAHGGVQKSFTGRTRDSLDLSYTRTRREFYSTTDSTIESRRDNLLTFANLLDYDIGGNIVTSLFVQIANRSLDKNYRPFGSSPAPPTLFATRIEEFHLDAYLQAAYRSDDARTAASARFYHSERDETHSLLPLIDAPAAVQLSWATQNPQEKSKDNLAKRTALSGVISLPLSLSDRLSAAAWVSLLRYDTPSDLNSDDRDELLMTASVGTEHRVSRTFQLAVSLDATVSHIVYLLAERSANNNINRVLRLTPKVLYRPVIAVTSMNAFEVLANYTVYDFENSLSQTRSFSYRQFGWLDSTAFSITDRIGLDFFIYLKLYERGQLKWSQFRERLQSSSIDNTLATQARFSPDDRTLFAVGIRYFSQTHYTYASGEKVLDSFLNSVGPTCLIQYQLRTESTITFRGWYERRRQPDGTSRTLGSMTLNLFISF